MSSSLFGKLRTVVRSASRPRVRTAVARAVRVTPRTRLAQRGSTFCTDLLPPAGFASHVQPIDVVSRRPLMTSQVPRLEDVAKVDLLRQVDADEVERIWVGFFKEREGALAAVVKPETWHLMEERLRVCPRFVIPVPRGERGVVTVYLEYSPEEQTVMFTLLDAYKRDGAAANPLVRTTFFSDLERSHEIILMQGSVEEDMIPIDDARLLINQLQIYYLSNSKFNTHVTTFNYRPDRFDFDALVADVDRFPEDMPSDISDGLRH